MTSFTPGSFSNGVSMHQKQPPAKMAVESLLKPWLMNKVRKIAIHVSMEILFIVGNFNFILSPFFSPIYYL
jgi:hypothetical protein